MKNKNETLAKMVELQQAQQYLITTLNTDLAELVRQRDELLAALAELSSAVKYAHMDSNHYTPGCAVCDALASSDFAIVAATGQEEEGV